MFSRRALVLLLLVFVLSSACNLTINGDSKLITPNPTTYNTQTASTTTVQQMPLVYYYFASIQGNTFPAGSVVIVPGSIILSPTVSKLLPGSDLATNVRYGLQTMIDDPHNLWTNDHLTIGSVTAVGNQMAVVLSGGISGAGDVVLIAARMQILMTVFANSAVQSATITLNGQNIANLGISQSSEAKPADYAYTRADVETFMRTNAYNP